MAKHVAVKMRRLVRRVDFLSLKEQGQRVMTQGFVLQWRDMADEAGLAVGFTASGALGGAVQRNRARRRLKAAFDAVCRLNPDAKGQGKWLVMVAKMPIFKMDYVYLVADMRKALREAGIIC
ncbi:MAG: ribonuclease P protein component [Proteobacteria bacterium]|nr:ribonuclease P protein component [Pseudomonadota bacterium]NBX86767.1 ribonuclease P protein component [Pseudomonadota bacterium]